MLVPSVAQADFLGKAVNTTVNTVFGWLECPKGIYDEVRRASQRGYVGVIVTGPVSCAVNTAARYTGVVADVVTLPFSGDNAIKPGVLDSVRPPFPIP